MKRPTKEFDPRQQCIDQFKKWWNAEEIKEKVIPSVASNHMFELIKEVKGIDQDVLNHELLANILYDIVGSKFLRKISDKNKITQKFRKGILDAAINSGNASKERIHKQASKYLKKDNFSNSDIANIGANHRRWLREFAEELDLPLSVADKQHVEKPDPMEIILPHSPQNALYDYQYATGLEILEMLKGTSEHKRRLISIPTGAGKTRLVVETLIDWLSVGKPGRERQHNSKFILWIAQSNELCEQAFSSFKTIFQDKGKQGTTLHIHRFWGTGNKSTFYDDNASVLDESGIIVASINSLYSIGKKQSDVLESLADLTSCIIIDEAHHSTSKMYTSVLKHMGFNFKKSEPSEKEIILLGLTATPFRGSGTKKDGIGFNDETIRLRQRYGDILFPPIDDTDGLENNAPNAIIDAPSIGRIGFPFKISGERSFDKDGTIEKFSWTVVKRPKFTELFSKDYALKNNCVVQKISGANEKNTIFTPTESGEYQIKLIVQDNEGEIGQSQTFFMIKEKTIEDNEIDEISLQKKLFKRLMNRKILCQVFHEEIKMSKQKVLTKKQIKELRDFGEYRKETLEFLAKDKERNLKILNAIKNYKEKGRKKILFFACTVEHAQTISLILNSGLNIKSRYVTGDMDIDERVSTINQFKNGDLDVLCNFNVLTTGFDAPNIDCVFVGRPARSTLLYTQMIGRGMRGLRSNGTDDVLVVDIDDNFQLNSHKDDDPEDMLILGWQLFKDFWKPWHTHKSITKGQTLTDELSTLACIRCKNQATGIEAIQKVFEPTGEPSGIIESLLNRCLDLLPKECLKCRLELYTKEQEIQKKQCPRCHIQSESKEKIEEVFGFRKSNGKIIPQSYCRKCRNEERKNAIINCPYVNYLSSQHRIRGNYQMVLGLYLIESQKNASKVCPANIFDARRFLLKHNPNKKPVQIGNNHPVFDVYKNEGLIEHVDRVSGKITFVPILDVEHFEKLCHDKLNEISIQVKEDVEKDVKSNLIQELVDTYKKIRTSLFKHPPTQRQFEKSLQNSKLFDLISQVYGSYHNFLEAQGDIILHNLELEDILYDEYFELYEKIGKQPSKTELDGYGNYTISDYVECFGSYENFINNVDAISIKFDSINSDITIDALGNDYSKLKEGLGHVPHFTEIKNKSKYGIEYYLHKFISYGRFRRIFENQESEEHIMFKLKEDYNNIRKILGIPLNLAQMMKHSDYAWKILGIFENYSEFLTYVKETEKPENIIPLSVIKLKQKELLDKFNNNLTKFNYNQAMEIFVNENALRYNEWFISKKKFVDKLSEDDWRLSSLYDKFVKKKIKKQTIKVVEKKAKTSNVNNKRNWWKICPKCGSKLKKFGKHNIQCANISCNYTR
jgi:superfamily II DNA or RNA helicase